MEDFEKKKKMENNLLKLNSNKSYRLLGWKNLLSFNKTISYTVDWYKNYKFNKKKFIILLSTSNQKFFKINLVL